MLVLILPAIVREDSVVSSTLAIPLKLPPLVVMEPKVKAPKPLREVLDVLSLNTFTSSCPSTNWIVLELSEEPIIPSAFRVIVPVVDSSAKALFPFADVIVLIPPIPAFKVISPEVLDNAVAEPSSSRIILSTALSELISIFAAAIGEATVWMLMLPDCKPASPKIMVPALEIVFSSVSEIS